MFASETVLCEKDKSDEEKVVAADEKQETSDEDIVDEKQ